ncbi:RTA1 like protein-domain-containing protein [Podospora conica]|nr:RTA1 like protein-domain-containing protein [Schizothecium conicum]
MLPTPPECTPETCPTSFSQYQPALAGNAFMIAAFAALVPVNLYAGARYKTPLYAALIVSGLLLEILGHVGAVLLRTDTTSHGYFSLYMMGTLFGPTLLGSANYLVLPRVMVLYGEDFSLIPRPICFSIAFAIIDIFTLAFQSTGVAFASGNGSPDEKAQAAPILIAGLSMQAISPAAFLLLYWTFRIRLTRRRYIFDPRYSKIYLSSRFNMMLLAMQAITSLLLIRAVMRAAAFCNGFHPSPTTNTLTVVLTFDDTLVLLAAVLLTAVPAGFGSFSWEKTSPFSSSQEEEEGDLLPLQLRRQQQHNKVSSISKPLPHGSPPLPCSEDARPPVRPYRAPPAPVEVVARPAMVRHPYDPKTPPVFVAGQGEGSPPLLPPRMGGHARKPSWPMPAMPPAGAGAEGAGLVGRDTLWT